MDTQKIWQKVSTVHKVCHKSENRGSNPEEDDIGGRVDTCTGVSRWNGGTSSSVFEEFRPPPESTSIHDSQHYLGKDEDPLKEAFQNDQPLTLDLIKPWIVQTNWKKNQVVIPPLFVIDTSHEDDSSLSDWQKSMLDKYNVGPGAAWSILRKGWTVDGVPDIEESKADSFCALVHQVMLVITRTIGTASHKTASYSVATWLSQIDQDCTVAHTGRSYNEIAIMMNEGAKEARV
ncbi:MAG: hypothetical protein J3Q66DRAFT_392883 [Benniella sp.]|nr:MAG: hypothetical protein J3Q66DRAFT_392883 [Benniella sp.]